MKKHSEKNLDSWEEMRQVVTGFGDTSLRKSYFPELQKRLHELARFRMLFDSSREAFLLLDTPSGTIVDANQPATDIFQLTLSEIIGTTIDLLGIPQIMTYVSPLLTQEHTGDSLEKQHKITISMADGQDKIFAFTIWRSNFDNASYIVITMVDVTAETQWENQLHHTRHLDYVSQLTGGLSHDFNNALVGIIGNTSLVKELLQEQYIDLDKIREKIGNLEECNEYARKMVRHALEFVRPKEMDFCKIDLAELLHELMITQQKMIPEWVSLTLGFSGTHAPCKADEIVLKRVFANIIVNAVRAMEQKRDTDKFAETSLSIDLCKKDLENDFNALLLSHREQNNQNYKYWVVSIKDTGIGIEPHVQKKIFDLFFSTKTKSKSSGMGLAMAYSLIRGHGGFILAESTLGESTTISVYLPSA